jgi:hypothetical protein
VHLKVGDIDSQRMMIRVEQGEGSKDRYVRLSPRLLEVLREYWKLVWSTPQARPMRFDLKEDPGEKTNVEPYHDDVVERLTKAYDAWFEDVRKTRDFAAPRTVLDPAHEDPVEFTRQDWRGPKADSTKDSDGFWLVNILKETTYDVTLRFRAPGALTVITYSYGAKTKDVPVLAEAIGVTLKGVVHPAGPTQIGATLKTEKPYGVDYIELKRPDGPIG